ncbi:extracellular matrix protein 2-like isoform X2 [Phyllobates terribilis]|uniref:extracellular matrix protein 2-like isoform X2 n=1 Tax=Phyllobates terribilis TaxID=111132 RepID=UPI003CCAC273
MNLLLTLLVFNILVSTGGAQKSRENFRTGLRQEAQRTSNSNVIKDRSSPTKKVPEHRTTGQRRGDAAVTGSPLVAGKGQCLVNGMIMYNGAAWSPQQCTICVCDQGKKVCEPLDCEEDITCPGGKLQIPPGECCPVCVKTATLNQRKVTMQKHKEVKKDTKQMKVKGDPTKITSRPDLGPNKTPNINIATIKPSKSRKTPVNGLADVTQEKSPAKKEINNRKQETNVQKKGVTLSNPKKEANGEKNSDVEGLKTPEKKQPTEVKTRDKAIKKGTTQIPSTMKPKMPNVETKNKQEDMELSPSTPTMPSVPSFIRPTLPHIPSLPSGCLLSEFTIACANTKMTYLPLMTDPGLKTLYLAENEISKLPARAFAGLPNLEWLDLSKNKLDDSGLSNDVFKNLTKLKRLNLDGNGLTVLPQLPASVQELKVNDNKLLELNRHSFRGLGNLLTLEMEGNGFHDGNVSPMTFKPLKKLIYLRLNRNHFRAIPSGLPTTIQELHLDNNRIEVVSEGILNKTLNLSVIVLSNNRLQEDRIAPRAWIHLMNVESLDLSHNRLVHVPSFLPRGAKQVILHHNQIELIPGYVFAHMKPGLEFLHLSHNHLRDDGVHAVSFFGLYKSLNELLLDNNYFQSIPRGILNLKSLQVLRLSFNKIRYVPLNSICDTRISQDSNLVSVHLENNYINRRLIPPTALSCIRTYYSVILRPQHEEYEDEEY